MSDVGIFYIDFMLKVVMVAVALTGVCVGVWVLYNILRRRWGR